MNDFLLETRVVHRHMATPDIVVLDLAAIDGTPLPHFDAGAHIDLHLPGGLVRPYSLCSDPGDTRCYRIGVLKDPNSRGGSIAVHAQLQEGTELEISPPRNFFPLAKDASRSYLFGGGIGITPLIAMAYELDRENCDFELHYCARNRERCAFLPELASARFRHKVFTHFDQGSVEQRFDIAGHLHAAPVGSHLYACGPAGFMDWVVASARSAGLRSEALHQEHFQAEVDKTGTSFEVVARKSGKSIRVGPQETILHALAHIGVKVQKSCEQGVCGTCMCAVLEGIPDHRDTYQTDEEKAKNDQILVCCSRSLTPRLVLDI